MSPIRPTVRTSAFLAALLLLGCSRAQDEPMPVDVARLTPEDSTAAIQVVVQFGERLKRVSTLAPDSVARESIRREYGDLVAPSLLEAWLRNVADAPGRRTSSPWPDRIEILAAAPVQTGASVPPLDVLGNIVERTSADPAGGASGRIPVRIQVARMEEGWRIVEFMQGRPEDALHGGAPGSPGSRPGSPPSAASADAPERAADALRAYYRAIAEGRYRDAYVRWGSDGAASRQSFDEFRKGFAGTASVDADVGPPGAWRARRDRGT